MALTTGWNSCTVSSWKLLISATVYESSVVLRTSPVYELPILPTTNVFSLYAFIICPTRAVVVVFPLVPVMAAIFPLS